MERVDVGRHLDRQPVRLTPILLLAVVRVIRRAAGFERHTSERLHEECHVVRELARCRGESGSFARLLDPSVRIHQASQNSQADIRRVEFVGVRNEFLVRELAGQPETTHGVKHRVLAGLSADEVPCLAAGLVAVLASADALGKTQRVEDLIVSPRQRHGLLADVSVTDQRSKQVRVKRNLLVSELNNSDHRNAVILRSPMRRRQRLPDLCQIAHLRLTTGPILPLLLAALRIGALAVCLR